MKPITILACGFLAAAFLPPASAQDNEAEKLFRDMEKKILSAKAFEVSFTCRIHELQRRSTRGELLVTQDDKARLKVSGDFGGKRHARFELVSDGKLIRTKGAKLYFSTIGFPAVQLGGQSEWETPKKLHAGLATSLSRAGMALTVFGLPFLGTPDPDAEGSRMQVYDFRIAPAEKIGEREAKVIHYRYGKGGGGRDDGEVTLWIDAKTLLPLKRSLVVQRSENERLTGTDTYYAFKLDPKIDAKAFELPKVTVNPAEKEENVPVEKLPKAVTEAAKKRFPKAELRSAVLARPGSEWLRPDQDKEVYILDMKERCDVPRYPFFLIALTVTPAGDITDIYKEIVLPKMPKEVKQFLEKNYPWETIQEIREVIKVKEGKEKLEHVQVFLSTADNRTRVFLFSPEGEFVKEEK